MSKHDDIDIEHDLPPDGEGDGGVADGDDDGGDDEDGEGHHDQIDLPLPGLWELYPALCSIIWKYLTVTATHHSLMHTWDIFDVEEEEDRCREDDAGHPCWGNQPLCSVVCNNY